MIEIEIRKSKCVEKMNTADVRMSVADAKRFQESYKLLFWAFVQSKGRQILTESQIDLKWCQNNCKGYSQI